MLKVKLRLLEDSGEFVDCARNRFFIWCADYSGKDVKTSWITGVLEFASPFIIAIIALLFTIFVSTYVPEKFGKKGELFSVLASCFMLLLFGQRLFFEIYMSPSVNFAIVSSLILWILNIGIVVKLLWKFNFPNLIRIIQLNNLFTPTIYGLLLTCLAAYLIYPAFEIEAGYFGTYIYYELTSYGLILVASLFFFGTKCFVSFAIIHYFAYILGVPNISESVKGFGIDPYLLLNNHDLIGTVTTLLTISLIVILSNIGVNSIRKKMLIALFALVLGSLFETMSFGMLWSSFMPVLRIPLEIVIFFISWILKDSAVFNRK